MRVNHTVQDPNLLASFQSFGIDEKATDLASLFEPLLCYHTITFFIKSLSVCSIRALHKDCCWTLKMVSANSLAVLVLIHLATPWLFVVMYYVTKGECSAFNIHDALWCCQSLRLANHNSRSSSPLNIRRILIDCGVAFKNLSYILRARYLAFKMWRKMLWIQRKTMKGIPFSCFILKF